MAFTLRLVLLFISPCGYFVITGLLSKVVEFSYYWALPLLIVYACICTVAFTYSKKYKHELLVREQQIKSIRQDMHFKRRRVVTDFMNIVQGHVKE